MNKHGSAYKIRSWRHTIDRLVEQNGTSLKEVCDYMDYAYNENGVSFYVKLPRKRTSYIGIGMALGQSVDVINSWITSYGGKRRLYAKDISEDLVWIYLINANLEDRSGTINYFRRYEEYQSVAYAVFRERWDEIVMSYENTADVEISLGQAEYGPEYDGIKRFVAEHMDAFKTAYSRPRKLLDRYVNSILDVYRRHPEAGGVRSLNAMRGYLDDSMINFLSGDSEVANVVDRKTGKRTINIKHIPKGRKKYIRLCLSLGMTAEELNTFLDLMGYAPLDTMDEDEGRLLTHLTSWESCHPLQKAFKKKYIREDENIILTDEEEILAASEMLQLRSDLIDKYEEEGSEFNYA